MTADPERILSWIRENLVSGEEGRRLGPGSDLLGEVGLDSLQIGELVDFLEREYRVAIALDEVEPANFRTAASIAALVDRLTSGYTHDQGEGGSG